MTRVSRTDPADFQPALLQMQSRPPSPLGRAVLYCVLFLVGGLIAWAGVARVDVVALAEGKLVPSGYLKIVQPTEPGQVREILVREGESVKEGQVLMRMDPSILSADGRALEAEFHAKRLALRRIDAQLQGMPLSPDADDSPAAFGQAQAQYSAYVNAHRTALAQEQAVRDKARSDLAAAREVRAKLLAVLPHYREQEQAFEKLARDGFAGRLMFNDKAR